MVDPLDHARGRFEANGLTFKPSTDDAGRYFGQCPRHHDRKITLDLEPIDGVMLVHSGPCGCLPYETIRQLGLDHARPHVPPSMREDVTRRRLGLRDAITATTTGDPYERLTTALEAAGLAGSRSDPGGVRGSGRYTCPACGALGDGHGLKVDRGDDGRALVHCFACNAGEEILTVLGLSWADLGWHPPDDLDAAIAEWLPDRPVAESMPATSATDRTVAEPTALDRLRGTLLDSTGLDNLPTPVALVGGVLYADSLAWLQGRPGSYKSFLALDVAGCVGSGEQWQGHDTATGLAVYLIAEGASGLRQRVRAWEDAYGHPMNGVLFLPVAVQAGSDAQWRTFVELVAELGPVLVVLDTQARVTVGMDENSAQDMGKFVARAEQLRQASGACVLVVHHEGRAGEHMRGSTAMEGAATTIVRMDAGDDVAVSCVKQKDAAPFDRFTLRVVPTGASVVLALTDGAVRPDVVLQRCAKWLARWRELFPDEWVSVSRLVETNVVAKTTFYENRRKLVEAGAIEDRGEGRSAQYQVRPSWVRPESGSIEPPDSSGLNGRVRPDSAGLNPDSRTDHVTTTDEAEAA